MRSPCGKQGDRAVADQPFVSGLHRKLLAHPCGGAVAAVGHIERAWSSSLPAEGGMANNRVGVFRSAMEVLMKGLPVGAAMEYFNQRYAYLGTEMSNQILGVSCAGGAERSRLETEIVRLWTARNDARDYVVNGDPAARLCVVDRGVAARPRECLTLRSVTVTSVEVAPAASLATSAPASEVVHDFTSEASPEVPKESKAAPRSDGHPLRNIADRVAKTFGELVSNAASLEVRTFVSNSNNAVAVTEDIFREAQLRAWTRIKINGDIDVCVPEVNGQIDTALWAVHIEVVKQAQAHRDEMFKMALSTIAGAFKA